MLPFELPRLLVIAVIALDVVAILRALTRSHGFRKTTNWILAVIAFPGLGAVLYLTLANPGIRRTTERMSASRSSLRAQRESEDSGATSDRALLDPVHRQVFDLATRLTGLVPRRGGAISLLEEDDHAIRLIEDTITAARRSIWVEYYIVRNDDTGRRFLDLLAAQAARGIEVRLLYDALGSWSIDSRRVQAIRDAGGQAVAFLPLNPLRRRWSVNLRNHRKIVVVDGEIGFTGGMNIGDEYSGLMGRKGLQAFRDTHLELRGPAVTDLARIFLEDWGFATGEAPLLSELSEMASSKGPIVGIVPSGPDQQHNATELVYFEIVNAARQRLWLASPYLVPDDPMLTALTAASLRGVDVRILTPKRSDVLVATLAARSFYPRLSRAGVRIFEYLPSMMHAKTLLVDVDLALVGSANVDVRSFSLNFELSVLVEEQAFVQELGRQFLEDCGESREFVEGRYTFLQRAVHGLARLFAPLL